MYSRLFTYFIYKRGRFPQRLHYICANEKAAYTIFE